MVDSGEALRQVMRRWTTGVSVVTSAINGTRHGMTVNSFTSISLEPPVVTVTLAKDTRTHALVMQSGILAITLLSHEQVELANLFAGRVEDHGDRFAALETFTLVSQAPLLSGGIGFIDGRVRQMVTLEKSTLFVVDVLAAHPTGGGHPLVYFNRQYHRLTHDS